MENKALISLLLFFLGLILVHRLTLGRDKRKEFNEAAMPVREWLLKQAESISDSTPPSKIELNAFVSHLSWLKKRLFSKAWQAQENARKNVTRDAYGTPTYHEPETVAKNIEKCLKYMTRK